MCGIAGFVESITHNLPKNPREVLSEMLNASSYRGPDSKGIWVDNGNFAYLGHNRLAILDLSSAGHQPMQSPSNRFCISFNGEIYNHLTLRSMLSKEQNLSWKGSSDTETILNCIECWGLDKTLEKLTGMFAFALWDTKNHELYLVRDRMGEKPLYYASNDLSNPANIVFASEIASLKRYSKLNFEIDKKASSAFLQLGYIPSPLSIYENTKKLQPGCFLKFSFAKRTISIKSYWRQDSAYLCNQNNFNGLTRDEVILNLEERLLKTIDNQMISDVPIGAFLSGGIDSSLVVSLMQKLSSSPVETFSIGFENPAYDESEYAKKIARQIGTSHNELIITPEMALDIIPSLQDVYSEPFADSSQIPTLLVSKFAKTKVTVSLSGDGGDELFCGYNRYFYTAKFWKIVSHLPLSLRKILSKTILMLPQDKLASFINIITFSNKRLASLRLDEKLQKAAHAFSARDAIEVYYQLIKLGYEYNAPHNFNLQKEFKKIQSSNFKKNYIEEMMFIDSQTYLPDDILVKVDRAAMFHSLETRVPFLDHEIVQFAWDLPLEYKFHEGKSKWILREILAKYISRNHFERPKMGFGIPIDSWIRGPLRDWSYSLLSKSLIEKFNIIDFDASNKILNLHMSGKRNCQYELWPLLIIQSWAIRNL